MIQSELKKLDDSDLIEELNRKQDIFNLCVYGILNPEFPGDNEGLYWIKEEMFSLQKEVEKRLINKS